MTPDSAPILLSEWFPRNQRDSALLSLLDLDLLPDEGDRGVAREFGRGICEEASSRKSEAEPERYRRFRFRVRFGSQATLFTFRLL
jgi:hypothetical protein